jgi:hypothetical protein
VKKAILWRKLCRLDASGPANNLVISPERNAIDGPAPGPSALGDILKVTL